MGFGLGEIARVALPGCECLLSVPPPVGGGSATAVRGPEKWKGFAWLLAVTFGFGLMVKSVAVVDGVSHGKYVRWAHLVF